VDVAGEKRLEDDVSDNISTPRVWFITGASSGFGKALATAALEHGDLVAATGRRTQALADVLRVAPERGAALPLDVTRAEQRSAALRQAIERFGHIDVLVNNAGRTEVGAAEETTDQELRDLFELHFFAPVELTRAVLPHMRQRRSGTIVQLSSMGGQVVAPGFSAYCATKFALEGYSETLALEVAPFGIKVLIVEPGAFRTGLFGAGAAYMSSELAAYADIVGPTRRYVSSSDGTQPGDPAKAAHAIMQAIEADDPPLRLPLGDDAVDAILAKLDTLRGEVERWQAVARATGFDTSSEPLDSSDSP
jgi:NAD(P)-dependent dehydrogenase (short-subunit alcohol dehydrogenase family)